MIYLIHFDRPYKHARHYLGYVDGNKSERLVTRLKRHQRGGGARLLEVVTDAGSQWRFVGEWRDGDRSIERRLKQRASTRHCPICNQRHSTLLYKSRKRDLRPFLEGVRKLTY